MTRPTASAVPHRQIYLWVNLVTLKTTGFWGFAASHSIKLPLRHYQIRQRTRTDS